ncbi:unnamed protein product [Tilletia controversa]|uniref:SWIM-type domain-containing protein n=1 Tax=Tilletia controversa TaxID=13291 RepID=A0A8X7MUT6_9BASI|nr:hypothetical protein CF336_g4831 [Tilletia laevis]KAE8248192.1 hypothetical protein A4X06_0g3893 [Tilletia controversa]CAD6931007.1 unnamed protein product [Tilletia controversa]CAD6952452.1 unnamed protein product [Tilletia controversa]CAD6980437.1 unnamed protein product [Tilletia controversa]
MNTSGQDEFDREAEAYLDRWKCCEEWAKYVGKTWLPWKEMWARAWRQEAHRGVDTNNYIESWAQPAEDTLPRNDAETGSRCPLVVPAEAVCPRLSEQRAQGLPRSRLLHDEQSGHAAKRHAQDLSYTDALALVSRRDDGAVVVNSFSASGQQYKLQQRLDALGDELELVACTCEAFRIREFPCKHMWLANRVLALPLSQFSRKTKGTEPSTTTSTSTSTSQPSSSAAVTPAAPPVSASGSVDTTVIGASTEATTEAAASASSIVSNTPSAGPSIPQGTAPSNATTPSSALVRVRADRDRSLEQALAEIEKISGLGKRLRKKMGEDSFDCSRNSAAELVARLEVVRHLMIDVVSARRHHDRQGRSSSPRVTQNISCCSYHSTTGDAACHGPRASQEEPEKDEDGQQHMSNGAFSQYGPSEETQGAARHDLLHHQTFAALTVISSFTSPSKRRRTRRLRAHTSSRARAGSPQLPATSSSWRVLFSQILLRLLVRVFCYQPRDSFSLHAVISPRQDSAVL